MRVKADTGFDRVGAPEGPILTIICPDMFGSGVAADAMQPLAAAALAAQTPDFWNLRFYDDRIEAIDFRASTDLVAISVLTFTAKRSYQIAGVYRQRGIPVVLGGFHPSLLPEEAAEYADCVVTGDAETVWPGILADFLAGKLRRRYDGGVCSDPGQIRFDRGIFRHKRYSPMLPVQAARGCRYACDFCSVHSFYGSALIARPAPAVLEEIRQLPGKLLFLCDDNLLAGGDELPTLLAGLKTMKRLWTCQISIDAAADLPLLKELADSGCVAVFIGFESLDSERLLRMGKAGNLRHPEYERAIGAFRDTGIMVCGAFVFGYPGDTADSVERCLRFAEEQKLTLCHFNTLFPFPRTRVYERLEAEGRLLYERWWLDPEYRYGQLMFRPHTIEPEALAAACQSARLRFNSWSSILRRAADRRHNAKTLQSLGAFLLSNVISQREIRRKQGQALGSGAGR